MTVMARPALLDKLRIDPFIIGILTAAGVAALLPADGEVADGFETATKIAIAGLFFLYGARLSPQEALAGMRHWRLHVTVLLTTFAFFPLLGLAAGLLVPGILTQQLYLGVLYLCLLPSTVQSSIAFTGIARGNVAAAICSSSFSNLLGVIISPLLVTLLLSGDGVGAVDASSIVDVLLQLLAPFLAGQLARPWIASWVARHRSRLHLVDRGSILLIVYTAFSEAVTGGIWTQLSGYRIGALFVVCCLVLGVTLLATDLGARLLGFDRADRITIVFCGSKKSLASGLPMASVLFAGQGVGLVLLPLMLFHQIQLMAGAWLARRYARGSAEPDVESFVASNARPRAEIR
jgi:sodium/bile acid cotransporter 7